MLPRIRTWKLFDRDDRSNTEIEELAAAGTRVLGRRDLESYLWDDEVVTLLADQAAQPEKAADLIADKHRLLAEGLIAGRPADDIKAISGQMYNECKRQLRLTQCGNTAVDFARITLAPLVTSTTRVFNELQASIFTDGI
jgi:hypothetical protein